MAEMRSAPTHLGRYKSFKNATCVLFDREPRSRDRRARSSTAPMIQRSDVCHVACDQTIIITPLSTWVDRDQWSMST